MLSYLSTFAKTANEKKKIIIKKNRGTADLIWVPILCLSISWQPRSCFHTFPVQRGRNLKARKQKIQNIWNISAWLNQPFQPVTMGGHGEGSNSTEKVALVWQGIVLPKSRTAPNKLRRSISGLKSKQVPSPKHVPFAVHVHLSR